MSSKLTVAIIDDEPLSVENSTILLNSYCPNVEIVGWAEDIEGGLSLLQKQKPELLLLDVELSEGTGFDLLNKLDNIDFQVVFVTAFDQYAIKAFEFSAIDFLLKPYSVEDLKSTIEKAIKNRDKNLYFEHLKVLMQNMDEVKKLIIPTETGSKILNIEDIMFFQADSNYTRIFRLNEAEVVASKTLKHFESQLSENDFFRVHHSYLVQRKHVSEILQKQHLVQLSNGKNYPISIRRMKAFIEWMKN